MRLLRSSTVNSTSPPKNLYAGALSQSLGNAPSNVPGFRVSGTKLYDKNGNEFIMEGVNHLHAWNHGMDETAIPAISKIGANTVRVVLSDGNIFTRDDEKKVSNLISLCERNNLVAVLEVHDHSGSNAMNSLDKAVDYWISIKNALQGKEGKVIINIANEWRQDSNGRLWAEGYKKAIEKLRNAGLKHTIMVDAAGWGQGGQSVIDYGQSVLQADPLKNTMFSIHMWCSAGKDAATIKYYIDSVLNKNLALCIGEFGPSHQGKEVDEQTIMDYCQEKKIGWLAWQWKGGQDTRHDISNNWEGTNLTEFGRKVVSEINES